MALDDVGFLLMGQSEIAEQAMRALELKGDLPQRVDPRIALNINADDWTRPEYLYLRRFNRFSQTVNVAAVAAQFSKVTLANPNILGDVRPSLLVVERIILTNTAGAALAVDFGLDMTGPSGTADAPRVTTPHDDRFMPNGASCSPVATMAGGNSAAASLAANQGFMDVIVPPTSSVIIDNPGFILTGIANSTFASRLMIQSGVVNVPLKVSLTWRERVLLTSER